MIICNRSCCQELQQQTVLILFIIVDFKLLNDFQCFFKGITSRSSAKTKDKALLSKIQFKTNFIVKKIFDSSIVYSKKENEIVAKILVNSSMWSNLKNKQNIYADKYKLTSLNQYLELIDDNPLPNENVSGKKFQTSTNCSFIFSSLRFLLS